MLALNSYKECVGAVEACGLFANELKKHGIDTIQAPISDGGDGFLEVCGFYSRLDFLTYSISTPYSKEKRVCRVGYDPVDKIVYIESAEVIGLKLIPQTERNPLYTSSSPLGELLNSINEDISSDRIKVREIIIGIGGTGTSDLGVGMMSELGLKVFDSNDKQLKPIPANYTKINRIEYSPKPFKCSIKIIVDVENQLMGSNGSNYLFARQKGAKETDLELLEKGFTHILNKLSTLKSINVDNLNGAGGGLAAAFKIFLNPEIMTANLFIKSKLSNTIKDRGYQYIITGEGAFDRQSLLNKGAYLIMKMFNDSKKVFLCSGRIAEEIVPELPENVHPIELSKFFKNPH
ncbi:MAG: glycerate kinase, partial [Bacteroidota bacterium]|nr:glycerate kinase [Bacteroidota bacterium]